jgi:hypothetical protein
MHMNETPVANEPADLKETCAALRHQLNSVLILLLAVSATLTVFFLRQVTLARKDRDNLNASVVEYQQNGVPALNDFTAKLREYAKTHPDVVPILTKYGVVQVSNAAPAAARAPGK